MTKAGKMEEREGFHSRARLPGERGESTGKVRMAASAGAEPPQRGEGRCGDSPVGGIIQGERITGDNGWIRAREAARSLYVCVSLLFVRLLAYTRIIPDFSEKVKASG